MISTGNALPCLSCPALLPLVSCLRHIQVEMITLQMERYDIISLPSSPLIPQCHIPHRTLPHEIIYISDRYSENWFVLVVPSTRLFLWYPSPVRVTPTLSSLPPVCYHPSLVIYCVFIVLFHLICTSCSCCENDLDPMTWDKIVGFGRISSLYCPGGKPTKRSTK